MSTVLRERVSVHDPVSLAGPAGAEKKTKPVQAEVSLCLVGTFVQAWRQRRQGRAPLDSLPHDLPYGLH